MIVTVTANPAVDLTWHVASLTLGGVHRADAGRARAGGKGLNVARIAHAQGAAVVAVTTTGGATGAEFAAELQASGVPHVLVPVAAATRRSIALVDEAEGDTTIVNERGVAQTAEEWAALKNAVAAVLSDAAAETSLPARDGAPDAVSRAATEVSGSVLVISGSFPPGTPDDLLPSLIRIGRDAGATVIADTSGPALLVAADAGASVLKPNEHELREATGLDDPVDGARELLRRGADLVLVSLGKGGMLAVAAADRSGADTPDVGPIRGKRPDSGVSASEVQRTDAGAEAPTGAADVLVISGSFPPGTPDDLLPALIRIGRDAGDTVIADTSGPALLVAADAAASVLKPNEHELRDATGLDDPIDGARELLRRGADLVLLSLGKDGMLAVSAADRSGADTPEVGPIRGERPESGVSAPPVGRPDGSGAGDGTVAGPRPSVGGRSDAGNGTHAGSRPAVDILQARLDTPRAGNPTGAGDAGVAACAVLMGAGIRDPERILRRATAWSAAAVLMPLAGDIHPTWPALESVLTVTRVTPCPSTSVDPKESR
jgi:fructose-1-phosphate kinase PfkB-like protein